MKKIETSKKLAWTFVIFLFLMIICGFIANLVFQIDISGVEYLFDYLFWLTIIFCTIYLPKSLVENVFKYNIFSFIGKTKETKIKENIDDNSGGEI